MTLPDCAMGARSDAERAWSYLRRMSSSYVGGIDFAHGLLTEMLAAVRAEERARLELEVAELRAIVNECASLPCRVANPVEQTFECTVHNGAPGCTMCRVRHALAALGAAK